MILFQTFVFRGLTGHEGNTIEGTVKANGLDTEQGGSLASTDEKSVPLFQLFARDRPLLEDVTHIRAVTDGPLQSLPLSILVTEQPKGALLNYEDYREVSWLAKSYALTTLPSVGSLRALRLTAISNTQKLSRLPEAVAESPSFARTTTQAPWLRGPGGGFSSRLRKHRAASCDRLRRFLRRGLGPSFAQMGCSPTHDPSAQSCL